MDFPKVFAAVKAAYAYAVTNNGRLAAALAVIAPAVGVKLSSADANILAEVVLFLIFIAEEVKDLVPAPAPAPVKK